MRRGGRRRCFVDEQSNLQSNEHASGAVIGCLFVCLFLKSRKKGRSQTRERWATTEEREKRGNFASQQWTMEIESEKKQCVHVFGNKHKLYLAGYEFSSIMDSSAKFNEAGAQIWAESQPSANPVCAREAHAP